MALLVSAHVVSIGIDGGAQAYNISWLGSASDGEFTETEQNLLHVPRRDILKSDGALDIAALNAQLIDAVAAWVRGRDKATAEAMNLPAWNHNWIVDRSDILVSGFFEVT